MCAGECSEPSPAVFTFVDVHLCYIVKIAGARTLYLGFPGSLKRLVFYFVF